MNHQTPSSELRPKADLPRFPAGAGKSIAVTSLIGPRQSPFPHLSNAASTSELPFPVHDPRIKLEPGGAKPVYLPAGDAQDAVALSLADNLFWVDAMEEYALFLYLLMPGDNLLIERQRALRFRKSFARHFHRLHQVSFTKANYRAINRTTQDFVSQLRDFNLHLLARQTKGKIHTLAYSLFFSHTAREAERLMRRLSAYNDGAVHFNLREVADFWSLTMGENVQLIAHLLEHQETAVEAGIATGQIKSIINPLLSDHVRREAVKYLDELGRTQC